MTNKEKFLALVSDKKSDLVDKIEERIRSREMLRESQKIALMVHMKLDELGWKQTHLALKLNVSPQQVTKILSGKENLTLETQAKLQSILDIPILASYYDVAEEELEYDLFHAFTIVPEHVNVMDYLQPYGYAVAKEIQFTQKIPLEEIYNCAAS